MAIDTAQKRYSMMGFGFAWSGGRLPVPDGSDMDSAGQRQMILGGYSGLDWGTGGIGPQTPAYWGPGGSSFDADGRMLTLFLLDSEPVPASAQFISGVAYDPVSGGRYVCHWPADNAVSYVSGAAIRNDGAMTILEGAIVVYHNVYGYTTQRGELSVTINVPTHRANGYGFAGDKLSVTEIN